MFKNPLKSLSFHQVFFVCTTAWVSVFFLENTLRAETAKRICKDPNISKVQITKPAFAGLLGDIFKDERVISEIEASIKEPVEATDMKPRARDYEKCVARQTESVEGLSIGSLETKTKIIKDSISRECALLKPSESSGSQFQVKDIQIGNTQVVCQKRGVRCTVTATINRFASELDLGFKKECPTGTSSNDCKKMDLGVKAQLATRKPIKIQIPVEILPNSKVVVSDVKLQAPPGSIQLDVEKLKLDGLGSLEQDLIRQQNAPIYDKAFNDKMGGQYVARDLELRMRLREKMDELEFSGLYRDYPNAKEFLNKFSTKNRNPRAYVQEWMRRVHQGEDRPMSIGQIQSASNNVGLKLNREEIKDIQQVLSSLGRQAQKNKVRNTRESIVNNTGLTEAQLVKLYYYNPKEFEKQKKRLSKELGQAFDQLGREVNKEYEAYRVHKTTYLERNINKILLPFLSDPLSHLIQEETQAYVGGTESVLAVDTDEISDNVFLSKRVGVFEQYLLGLRKAHSQQGGLRGLNYKKTYESFLKALDSANTQLEINELNAVMDEIQNLSKGQSGADLKILEEHIKDLNKQLKLIEDRLEKSKLNFYVNTIEESGNKVNVEVQGCSHALDRYSRRKKKLIQERISPRTEACYSNNDISLQVSLQDVNQYLKMHYERFSPYEFCGEPYKDRKGQTRCKSLVKVNKPFQLKTKGPHLVLDVGDIRKDGFFEFVKVDSPLLFPRLLHETGLLQTESINPQSRTLAGLGVVSLVTLSPAILLYFFGKEEIRKGAKEGLDIVNKNLSQLPLIVREVHPSGDGTTLTIYADVRGSGAGKKKIKKPKNQLQEPLRSVCYPPNEDPHGNRSNSGYSSGTQKTHFGAP